MKSILSATGTKCSIKRNQLIIIFLFTLFVGVINSKTTYADFRNLGNGTILDKEHSLLWQQSDDGVLRNFEEAYNYCKNLSIGNNSDWELPYAAQLETLINLSRCPTIDPNFSAQPSIYFTISPGPSMLCMSEYGNTSVIGSFAVINFNNGNIFTQPSDCITEPVDGFTRCVSEYKEQVLTPILHLLLSQ